MTEYNKKQKEKHDKILMLAESKLNSIETLVSQALIDLEISHEEFITILKEKGKYEKMKENVRNVNQKQENMRLNRVTSRIIVYFLCKYKNEQICSFTTKAWKKDGVEAIECSNEIWVNQKHFKKQLDIANISERTQYYSSEFKRNEMLNTRA